MYKRISEIVSSDFDNLFRSTAEYTTLFEEHYSKISKLTAKASRIQSQIDEICALTMSAHETGLRMFARMDEMEKRRFESTGEAVDRFFETISEVTDTNPEPGSDAGAAVLETMSQAKSFARDYLLGRWGGKEDNNETDIGDLIAQEHPDLDDTDTMFLELSVNNLLMMFEMKKIVSNNENLLVAYYQLHWIHVGVLYVGVFDTAGSSLARKKHLEHAKLWIREKCLELIPLYPQAKLLYEANEILMDFLLKEGDLQDLVNGASDLDEYFETLCSLIKEWKLHANTLLDASDAVINS